MSSHSHCTQAPLRAPGDVVQAARALHCCQGLGPLPLQFGLGRSVSRAGTRRRPALLQPTCAAAGGPAAAEQGGGACCRAAGCAWARARAPGAGAGAGADVPARPAWAGGHSDDEEQRRAQPVAAAVRRRIHRRPAAAPGRRPGCEPAVRALTLTCGAHRAMSAQAGRQVCRLGVWHPGSEGPEVYPASRFCLHGQGLRLT